jgi:hypothetical protein
MEAIPNYTILNLFVISEEVYFNNMTILINCNRP